jgi:hypothetical protein
MEQLNRMKTFLDAVEDWVHLSCEEQILRRKGRCSTYQTSDGRIRSLPHRETEQKQNCNKTIAIHFIEVNAKHRQRGISSNFILELIKNFDEVAFCGVGSYVLLYTLFKYGFRDQGGDLFFYENAE